MAVRTIRADVRWTSAQRWSVVVAVLSGLFLRWAGLGRAGLSFDESFTAAYASLPLTDIPSALRTNDSHPPLDYFLRHFFTASELSLRAPSALFSSLALVGMAVWMRRRGWLGVATVTLFAFSPFEIVLGRQARMYALMTLVGVLVAMLCERWLDGDERRRVPVGVGLLLAVGCLNHVGGLLLAGGVVLVAGRRTDAAAWLWRGAAAAGVLVWGVVWAPSFVDQARLGASTWIPLTSPGSLDDTIDGLVTLLEGTRWIVSALVILGGAALWARDRVLAKLWCSLFLAPLAALGVLGLRYHVLLPRTLAASGWAAPLALAACVDWAWRRWRALGLALGALVALVTLRSVSTAWTYDEGNGVPMAAIARSAAPGDGIAIRPHWLWPLAWWELDTGRGDVPPALLDDSDVWYWQRPGAPATGRTWVAEPRSYHLDLGEWPSCGAQTDIGADWELACVVTGGGQVSRAGPTVTPGS